ncbi:Sec1 family protein [Spironucleus salmonicida]|uniref:Sec1 family protein n=1 Tax=Spironucleus salmonicida TaxID=348837 RepID=V6LGH6_9EUKA|nr:Sec1 family protein [Spironucleus salmonicida]|eukprot:EST43632.1 Sec1 family protein [Spironucleus salmonicida]
MSVQTLISNIYNQIKLNGQNIIQEGPKMLILDEFTTKFMTLAISQNQLLQDDFLLTSVLKSIPTTPPLPNTHASIFIASTSQNHAILHQILAKKNFCSVSIFFSQQITDTQLSALALADTHFIVNLVKILPANFTPIQQNLIISDDFQSAIQSFNISQVIFPSDYKHLTTKIDLKKQGKNLTKLLILPRNYDLIAPLIPGAAFCAVLDSIFRSAESGKIHDFPLNFFALSDDSKQFYILDILQSSDFRAEKALNLKGNVSTVNGQMSIKQLQKILQNQENLASLQTELTNFSGISQLVNQEQKVILQSTISIQEFALDPTSERLKSIFDIFKNSVKSQNVLIYAQTAFNLWLVFTQNGDHKKLEKIQRQIIEFYTFLNVQNPVISIDLQSFKERIQNEKLPLKIDISEVENLAKCIRQSDARQFQRFPIPNYCENALKIDKKFNFYQVRPVLLTFAEAIFSDQKISGFDCLGEENQWDNILIYVDGDVSLHETACLSVFEYAQGRDYEVMRGVSQIVVLGKRVGRWDDVE